MQREVFINALSEIELLNTDLEIEMYYKMKKIYDDFSGEVSK